jgi:S1-C subfamily serine protease
MPRRPTSGDSTNKATRLRLVTAATLACQLLAGAAGAQVLSIEPGIPVRGEVIISDNPDAASFVTFSFEAPDDVLAVSIDLEAVADLDLYFDSEYIDDYQDVLAASTGFAGEEHLKIDLSSNPDMIADEYFIDVTYGRIDPPVNARGETLRQIPFTLTLDTHGQRVDAELEPDTVISDRIDPRSGGPFRSFAIDVPNGTSALRVDLASDETDLDLRVRHRNPMRTTREADTTAVSWAGHETIVVSSASGSIRSGRYYIDVFDQAWLDWPADFRLVASFSNRPPSGLIDLPQLASSEGLAGAINATVEILHDDGGGTGVLLSETGYILTNYHVVEQVIEGGTWASAHPLIGLTVEPAEGSRVRLLASVIAHDRELDIALLRADADLYGSPLPAGYRFPAITLGNPESLALGDSLFVLGYPDAGSLGTRVSITATRGIVSGFERRGDTLLVKTDADIASGNSGGPVLNERHELIGIATEAISEEFGNSQIGYIWPLWLVPEDWWAIAAGD